MLFCPNMRLIMVSEHAQNSKVWDMVHVRCKQWTCPYCSKANAKLWKNHILTRLSNHEFSGLSWVLITITAHENAHKAGPIYTLKNLQRGWKKMYHRLKRWNGGPFEYVRIFEKHTDGKYGGYHMHIVASIGDAYGAHKIAFYQVLEREGRAKAQGKRPRKRLKREKHPTRWIRDTCRKLGMGFEADVTQIGSMPQKAAGYMTKYISKQLEILEFPPRMRRVQASRKLGTPYKKTGSKLRQWRAKSAIFKEDVMRLEKIIDVTTKHIISIEDDFSNGELWYPPELL